MVKDEQGQIHFYINRAADGDGSRDTKVYVKNDGKRFTDGRTLKLEKNTPYILKIEINHNLEEASESERKLTALFVNSIPLTLREVEAEENKSNGSQVYEANFNTSSVRQTQDSERDTLIICAHVDGIGAFLLPVQTKYYSQEDEHKASMGKVLDYIVLEYLAEKSSNGSAQFQVKKAMLMTVSKTLQIKESLVVTA